MKTMFISIAFLFITNQILSQERFRRDYNHFIVDIPDSEKSGKYPGHNVFIFNYNDNGDVKHITSERDQIIYVRTSPIEKKEHEDGTKYSFFKSYDEHGEPIVIKVYDQEKYGVEIIGYLKGEEKIYKLHFITLD